MRIHKLYLLFFAIAINSCRNDPEKNATNLTSISIDEKEDRIESLSKYVKFKSPVLDCEFDLFNVNGFENNRISVPGASSWNYKFGVIVKKSDIPKWTTEYRDTTISNPDYSWILNLITHRPENWSLHSKPKFYVDDSGEDILVLYEQEGVIFRKVVNL